MSAVILRETDTRPLRYRVGGRRPFSFGDLNETLGNQVLRSGEHDFLDGPNSRRIDVCGLVSELISSAVEVGIGDLDVPHAADVLLAIRPGESLRQYASRARDQGLTFKRALWDWRHAAAVAGMRLDLSRPGLCLLDGHGLSFIDGHHRLGALAFRQEQWMPIVLVDDKALIRRYTKVVRRARRWFTG